MSNQVWSLSVDLQTKTAVFTSGLSDAAKAARGSFAQIKSDAADMGRTTSGSMMEARGAVVLLGDQFGVHMPREISRLIAVIPGIGGALEALLPIMGAVWAAQKIYEWAQAAKAAKEATASAWAGLDSAANSALHKMDEELLSSQAKVDDLDGKHLKALQERLHLIDEQSLDKLVDEFEKVAASADKAMATLQGGWLQQIQGKGEGVEEVKNHFDSLQQTLSDLRTSGDVQGFSKALSAGIAETMKRQDELNQHASSFHTEERAALAAELNALISQTQEKEKQAGLDNNSKKVETSQYNAARAQEAIAAAKAEADVMKSLMQQAAKYHEAMEHYNEEMADSQRNIDNLMAESNRKQEELNAKKMDSFAALAEATKKAQAEGGKTAIQGQLALGLIGEQEAAKKLLQIDKQEAADYKATLDGKLAALRTHMEQTAALAEQSKGTNQQEATQTAAGEAQIEYNKAVAQGVAETQQLNDKVSQQQTAVQKLNESWSQMFGELRNQVPSMSNEMQQSFGKALDSTSEAISKTIVEGKDLGTEMKGVAREMLESWIQMAVRRMALDAAMTIEHVTGNQVQAESDKASAAQSQLAAAKAAAAKAYQSMSGIPLVGPELGAVAAAAVFAGAMAFELGGIVPGVGRGDTVPAMLTPGEAVLPKRLTENLTHAARSGGSGGPEVHNHITSHYTIHAIDGASVHDMLTKHADAFHEHTAHHIRKMNH